MVQSKLYPLSLLSYQVAARRKAGGAPAGDADEEALDADHEEVAEEDLSEGQQ